MGFLSFLKRENERLRAPLKAQAYEETTASKPPVKGEPRTADGQQDAPREREVNRTRAYTPRHISRLRHETPRPETRP